MSHAAPRGREGKIGMLTCGTYFTGGGIGTIGLMAAGFTPLFGVEYDAAIAAVYAANIGPHIITGRVQDIDPATLPYVDLFQASPVCKEFSAAKTGGMESTEELSQAHAICAYIRHHLPRLVVIENVEGYKRSKSYARIIACLNECGYWHDADVLNSADMGVPQTRRRLIVRAVREGFVPQLPPPVRWVGWYEAIADLIPTLPEDKFADWQLARLPNHPGNGFAVAGSSTSFARADPNTDAIAPQTPYQTVLAGQSMGHHRAFLVPGDNASNDTVRDQAAPMVSITAGSLSKHPHRAFVMDGQTSDNGESITVRHGDAPIYTVSASMDHRPARAFLLNSTEMRSDGLRVDDEPIHTLTTGNASHPTRAFIVDASNMGRPITVREEKRPMQTLDGSGKGAYRAWLSQGKVVRMTPRALARFMSIPDWYELPASNKLACTIIGNGVPSLMMQGIAESLLSAIQECAA